MSDATIDALRELALRLVDQESACVIVEPNARRSGYWFGGGNVVESTDGTIYVPGRYRNKGDSTTGLGAGERGLELALFASKDRGSSFTKVLSLTKEALSTDGAQVLSIEGSALLFSEGGVELFVSTEKAGPRYPEAIRSFQKPGTGVWTIDRLRAPTVADLATAPIEPLLGSDNPEWLHVKDPSVFVDPSGNTHLLFCTHPFTWASSNSAYAIRRHGSESFDAPVVDFFPRGFTWDVSVTRLSDVLPLRHRGTNTRVNLAFYDGAECMRSHQENARAVSRPRGYSCEEIAGLAWFGDGGIDTIERVSRNAPLFVSPYGTGCSRYIHACAATDGIYTAWQQGQDDGSQPLVMNFVAWDEISAFEVAT